MSTPTHEIIVVNASLNALTAAYDRNTHVTTQLLKEAAARVANLKKAIEEQKAANCHQETAHQKELEPLAARIRTLQTENAALAQQQKQNEKILSEIPSFADLKVKFDNYFKDYLKRHPKSVWMIYGGGCVIC